MIRKPLGILVAWLCASACSCWQEACAQPPGFEASRHLQFHVAPLVASICQSPDGKDLVFACAARNPNDPRGSFSVFSFTEKGISHQIVRGRFDSNGSFSENGEFFFGANAAERRIEIWNARSWSHLKSLHEYGEIGIVVGDRSREILAVSGVGYRFDCETGKRVQPIEHKESFFSAVTAAGSVILMGAEDGSVQVRNRDLKLESQQNISTSGEVTSLDICAHTSNVAIGMSNGQVSIWSSRCEKRLNEFKTDFRRVSQVEWLDKHRLLICSSQGRAVVLDVETGKVEWEWGSAGGDVFAAVAPDFSRLTIVESLTGDVNLWSKQDGR